MDIKRYLPHILVVLALILGITIWKNQTLPVSATASADVRTVIIDAGHGGEDGGANSLSGLHESGINLAIAKKTDALLQFFGVNTLMLRDKDISIHDPSAATIGEKKRSDLKNRVKIVNNTQNSVLISIHQNFFEQSQYYGAQVFWGGKPGSKDFALLAQETLRELNPDNKRQAKPVQSSVFVMNHVECPAILAECGFISNREDEARLTSPEYQKKVAAALVAAYTQWEG
jgi:N-acetylmuramoyl-L-alanine amidase